MLDISFNPFPVLSSGRITLRKITNNDAARLFEFRSDREVMKYIDRPLATSMDDAYAFLKKIDDSLETSDGISWAIALEGDPQMIGTMGLWRFEKENHRAEIGYMLSPAYHRKGIMQEAFYLVIDYGFNVLGLHTIEAKINPGNQASKSLLEKNGFIREGYFKENFFFNGNFLDTAVYTLFRPVQP